ncbi:putative cell-wall binding lipoprotein [Cytobacillus firmus]|uniref:Putative cell-wall binding lipoprotein n=2 Tax=Cytobacillus TaxID=2675230 RepID=A0A366K181_CYTFI|nr:MULTISPECIES: YkyA family protein [Cytobacillus]RBP95062.1 putative cell-wall binding lipoprotein [Cytobacillus firmus]TDX43903.1 putative cell-wall binding lipoprotein [Cytobacillus oceanisediminis]
MSILNKSRLLLVFIIGAFILTGCMNSPDPEEKIYDVLENVVAKEKDFEKQQEPLVKLEKREKELYDKIINLGMKDFKEIKKLSDEASSIVEQRVTHMEKEQESIQASKKEFETLSPTIEEIEDKKLKDKAKELYEIMMDRYKIHDTLYKDYSKATQLDKELYAMFKKEDLTLEQLEGQVSKINDMYEKILASNKQFNEKTKEYNEAKLNFYKEAGLEIKTEE